MSELEQLRQEAEQLRNQIRVRDWRVKACRAEWAGPGVCVCWAGWGRVGILCECEGYPNSLLSYPLHSHLLCSFLFCLFLTGSAVFYRMPEKHVGIQH